MKTSYKIALVSFLWLLLINAGNLGILDTDLRLEMAHSWWTGESPIQITERDIPKVRGDIRYGVMGADGQRYIAYEQGQSILMLPGDWIGSQLHSLLPILDSQDFRKMVVSFLIFVPLNVATVLACYWLLKVLDFEENIAALASLLWMASTTFLFYAQVHQQNNQVLLLTILGYAAALVSIKKNNYKWAFLSGLAAGGVILIRISGLLNIISVFVLFIGGLIYKYRQAVDKKIGKYLRFIGWWFLGVIPLSFLGRILDFNRFGSFLATGKRIEKMQLHTDPLWDQLNLPHLVDNYPLVNPPHVGIFGPLFSPAKSIFIYDPLLLPCLVICIWLWKHFSPWVKWYVINSFFALGLHLFAYSRFIFWHGDSAWGARYHVTSVHLILIPLLAYFIQYLLSGNYIQKVVTRTLIVGAIIIQILSVSMPDSLEWFQTRLDPLGENVGYSLYEFRLGHRIINLACLAQPDWSERCIADNPQKQYLQRLNHLNFFPFFLLHRNSQDPSIKSLAQFLIAIWFFGLIITILVTYKIILNITSKIKYSSL